MSGKTPIACKEGGRCVPDTTAAQGPCDQPGFSKMIVTAQHPAVKLGRLPSGGRRNQSTAATARVGAGSAGNAALVDRSHTVKPYATSPA